MIEKGINNEPFIVGESAWMNYALSIFFFIIFAFALFFLSRNGGNNALRNWNYIILVALLPALKLFSNAKTQKEYIRIDNSGITFNGKFLTGWENFLSAYIFQPELPGSLEDKSFLIIEHHDPVKPLKYITQIKMLSTQNKSEEEIISIITEHLKKLNRI
jgi:thiol:disulfide interchange protein